MSLSALSPLLITLGFYYQVGFPGGLVVKESACHAGDSGNVGLIPGLGSSPAEGNGNLLQYSCLENLMDRGAWRAAVYRVTQSQTRRDLERKLDSKRSWKIKGRSELK